MQNVAPFVSGGLSETGRRRVNVLPSRLVLMSAPITIQFKLTY
jgi:hypothetical protein